MNDLLTLDLCVLRLHATSGEIRVISWLHTVERCERLAKLGYLDASGSGRYYYLTDKAYAALAAQRPDEGEVQS